MSSVWVLTSGEYSDYSIEAVFATKEAAEATFQALGELGGDYAGGDWNEPFEIGVESEPWRTVMVYAVSWYPGGTGSSWYSGPINTHRSLRPIREPGDDPGPATVKVPISAGQRFPVLTVEGTDPEKVRKVASDRITRFIAEQDLKLQVPEIAWY